MQHRVAQIAVLAAAMTLGTEAVAQQPPSPDFSWAQVRSHPLAAPGGELEGLPDGDYLTPTEDQSPRCSAGCGLYALSAAMAVAVKIQSRDPGATVDLSEATLLDDHGVNFGQGELCNSNCSITSTVSMPCLIDVLETEGLARADFEGVAPYSAIRFRIADDGAESFSPGDFEVVRQRILRAPVVATWVIDASGAGKDRLFCRAWGQIPRPYPPGQHNHHVLIVGYRWEGPYPDLSHPGEVEWRPSVQLKESWGKNARGFSQTRWVPWLSGCIFRDTPWFQVLDVDIAGESIDQDVDGIPDARDVCLGLNNGRGSWPQANLDGDGLGDPCDPDMDGDGVLDAFDCSPFNRYTGLDLDLDGHCDDPTRGRYHDGPPFRDYHDYDHWYDNLLRTPALIDYKDHPGYEVWSVRSVNDDDVFEDGDNLSNVDLSATAVCQKACDRLAAMGPVLRPSGFHHVTCLERCDPAITPWDTCSPLSSYGDPVNLHGACRQLALHGVTTHTTGAGPGTLRPPAWYADDLEDCRRYWFNPGLGQRDTDGDGVGDFCDAEAAVAHLQVSVDMVGYHRAGPDGIGHEVPGMRCYSDEVDVRFDTWGGRAIDGDPFGIYRDVAIEACQCRELVWGGTCEGYCPADGEYPSNGSAEYNPGPDNRAWDPINSPWTCGSRWSRIPEAPGFCADEVTAFLGEEYGRPPTQTHAWHWSPFYDPDREVGGALAEHPSPVHSEASPVSVKLRVTSSGEGEVRQTLIDEPFHVLQGCTNLFEDLDRSLGLSPELVIPPVLLYELPRIGPPDTAAQPGAALALVGDHLLAINPLTGALRAAQPLRAQAGELLIRAGHLAVGLVPSADLAAFEGTIPGAMMPVAYHHDRGTLWLGALWSGQWMPWAQAHEVSAPASSVSGLVSGPSGEVRLVGVAAETHQWTVYESRGASWRLQASFTAADVDPELRDVTVVGDASGRAVYLFGGRRGDGVGGATRLDLASNRATILHPSDWPLGAIVGAYRSGDVVYLVGTKVARFDLIRARLELLDIPAPPSLEVPPYVYFDPSANALSMMALDGLSPPQMMTTRLDEGRGWTTYELAPDPAPPDPVDEGGCGCTAGGGEGAAWPWAFLALALLRPARPRKPGSPVGHSGSPGRP